MLTLGPCINNDAMLWKLLMMNRSGEGSKDRSTHFSLLPSCLQSTGRRSLSTLELECLSFTHQTICFIRFIFSPSDSAEPDRALMMKRRGHPCIISEWACKKVLVNVHACVFVLSTVTMWFRQVLAKAPMPTTYTFLTTCTQLISSSTFQWMCCWYW